MGAFLGCKHTLLAYVALLINQHPQVFLLRAAFYPFSTQSVFVLETSDVQLETSGNQCIHRLCIVQIKYVCALVQVDYLYPSPFLHL